MRTLQSKGFTLIEMMVAVAVVGILAAIALPIYSNYTDKARATDIIVKYDALRSQTSGVRLDTVMQDCAQLLAGLGSGGLSDDYATLAYGLERVPGGYRPVLNVCSTSTQHGPVGVRVARAAHEVMSKTGSIESGAVLTGALVSFAMPLTDGSTPVCAAATRVPVGCGVVTGTPQAPVVPVIGPVPGNAPPVASTAGVTAGAQPQSQMPTQAQSQAKPAALAAQPAPVSCKPNEHQVGQRCISCDAAQGEFWSNDKQACVQACGDNQVFSLASFSCSCVAGWAMNSAKTCVAKKSCGAGARFNPDTVDCQCSNPNQRMDTSGNCFAPLTCQANQVLSADGKSCVMTTCPSGQRLADNGACFKPPVCRATEQLSADGRSCQTKTCASGQRLGSDGNCFVPPRCSGGQQLSSDGRSCACPGSSTWNENSQKCVGQGHNKN